jgi:hypothetical protein
MENGKYEREWYDNPSRDPPVATLSPRVATYEETMTLTKVKKGKKNNFQEGVP